MIRPFPPWFFSRLSDLRPNKEKMSSYIKLFFLNFFFYVMSKIWEDFQKMIQAESLTGRGRNAVTQPQKTFQSFLIEYFSASVLMRRVFVAEHFCF